MLFLPCSAALVFQVEQADRPIIQQRMDGWIDVDNDD